MTQNERRITQYPAFPALTRRITVVFRSAALSFASVEQRCDPHSTLCGKNTAVAEPRIRMRIAPRNYCETIGRESFCLRDR